MLFVPQDFGTGYPGDQGYMVCMMPPAGQFDLMDGGLGGFGPSPSAVASKALAIKNPATGEVIAKGQGFEDHATRTARRRAMIEQADLPSITLAAAAKSGVGAAMKVMAKRQGSMWSTDRSTFAALNIDVVRRNGRPLVPRSSAKHGVEHRVVRGDEKENDESVPAPVPSSGDAVVKDDADLVKAQGDERRQQEPGPPKKADDPPPPSSCSRPWRPKTVRSDSMAAGEAAIEAAEEPAAAPSGEPPAVWPMERGALLQFRLDRFAAQPAAEVERFWAQIPEQQPDCFRQASGLSASGASPDRKGAKRDQNDKAREDWRATRASSSQSLPTPSPKAYRPEVACFTPKSALEELKRTAQSLLNKVCPESVVSLGEKLAEVKVTSVEELELLISVIFKKALAEPHYCETYADLVFSLKTAFPQYPAPDGGKPVTFRSVLLNICQAEFEALPTSLEPSKEDLEMDPEELTFERNRIKGRVLANMKFIGHLFLRQLLSAKVIGSVIQELTLCDSADQYPQEHVVECACELLMSIGHTLDSTDAGKRALGQVFGRLLDLKQCTLAGGKSLYSKRVQFRIQDLLEIRANGWTLKTFKAAAKTKEEIRLDQNKQLAMQAKGKDVNGAEQVVVGQRPLYIAAASKEDRR